MKLNTILLGFVGLLGLAVQSFAATAFWSEEADVLPSLQDPAVWGVCAAPCASGKFGSANDMIAAFEQPVAGEWRMPSFEDGGVYDDNNGMGVINGPGGPGVPSPLAGLTQFTVEARFKIENPENLVSTVTGGANVGDRWGFHMDNDSTGNIPWSFRYGISNGQADPGGVRVLINQANPGTLKDFNIGLTSDWNVVRVIENYDAAVPANNYVDFYFNGVHLTTNPGDAHTLTILSGIQLTRNRTFNLGGGGGANGGAQETAYDIDYIRMADSIVPISEPLNAPGGGGCGGDLNNDGTTDGADVAIIYNNWGTVASGNPADINVPGGDLSVDGADLGKVFDCWGLADVGPTSVPEPASIGILGVGLVGLLAARRRS